jgi:tetratricopeptide (TPR) repeat protein
VRTAALAIAVLAAFAAVARAAPAAAQGSGFWRETVEPGCAVADETRRSLWHIVGHDLDQPTWVVALARASRVVERCPSDPELRFLRARLLYDLGRWEESAAELDEVIALDGGGSFAPEAAFTLGVALTRLGRFEDAARAYRRFLEDAVWPQRRAIALTNLAETIMALDRLDEARELFAAAVAADPTYTLGYFGLAVALDRLGEQGQALAEMLHGLSIGLGLEELLSDAVFYVPDWEIHYYRALAHEALGEPALALTQWQAFLGEGGAGGPYADLARAHAARLVAERR